ncbi:MAG: ATP-binding protein [Anaerolineae bacterium]|nr:ATP-binding protein [Anaerolineae bacterium]
MVADSFFGDLEQFHAGDDMGPRLGVVVGGSLSKGLTVKIDRAQPVENFAVGRYVVAKTDSGKRFFCMVTDVALDNTNPAIQADPPDISNRFLREVHIGTTVFGKVNIQPMLMIDDQAEAGPKPVKTIPGHFTDVHTATAGDVESVFGADDAHHFPVGSPLELETTSVNLNLDRLVQRSVGVFGKSGTGKSFFTRLLLAGVIQRKKAVTLIFDMHNDYGYTASDEQYGNTPGLNQLFPNQVVIAALDPEQARRRNTPVELDVKISYTAIEPEDLAMLKETMTLSDAMIDACFTLHKRWHEQWVSRLIKLTEDDRLDLEENTNLYEGTVKSLQRRVQRFERWGFLVEEAAEDSIQHIMNLLQQGKSVVLEFGKYGNSLDAYILVANYITRRIHSQYVEQMELAQGKKSDEPRQLMITVEEAHKFLDPSIASQTIFGIIARELRKYNVTLLVVDQRPSGIDEEVMSQIGTRITALLDNERDINAVLNGVSGGHSLREVLARLDTQQQAIIMGHAVPMPVVIQTRDYNTLAKQIMDEQRSAPRRPPERGSRRIE